LNSKDCGSEQADKNIIKNKKPYLNCFMDKFY